MTGEITLSVKTSSSSEDKGPYTLRKVAVAYLEFCGLKTEIGQLFNVLFIALTDGVSLPS